VLAVVVLVAVVLLSVGPVSTAPLAGVVLGLCAITGGASTPSVGRGSGVRDEPGPLRP
jgi:hypothetical protein